MEQQQIMNQILKFLFKHSILFPLLFLSSCKILGEGKCDKHYHSDSSSSAYQHYITDFFYVPQNAAPACYTLALQIAEHRESFDPVHTEKEQEMIQCQILAVEPNGNYFVDEIPSKFTEDLNSLNSDDIIELANKICPRNASPGYHKIEDVTSFEVRDSTILVEYLDQEREVKIVLERYLNNQSTPICNLYTFHCNKPFYHQD